MKKSIILLITIILVSFSCKDEKQKNIVRNSFFCNSERISQINDNQLCDFNDENIIFKGKDLLNSDFSFSGKTSLKLTDKKQFAFSFEIPKIVIDDIYKVTVWFKGDEESLAIVAQGKNFYKKSNKVVKNSNGWKQMILKFTVPPNFNTYDKIKVYVWNYNKKDIYVDDFKVEVIPSEITHIYKEKPLRIYIEDDDLNKLKEIRINAFKNKVLETNEDSWVKAMIFYGDETYKAKLRFKGDWLDHLQGIKWSFRIKLKKNASFKGMKEFSIQTPAARYFIDEWLAHKIFEKEDVLTTRYDFVPVFLNGKNLGLYVYEEHFLKQLVENKKRREGPILKFSEDQMWKARIYGNDNDYPIFLASEIVPFKENKTISNKQLHKQFDLAQNLLHKYKFLSNNASEIFDVDKLAKYMALVDLTRAYHGIIWHNQRFYYNPVLSRLEPIAYDNYCDEGVMQWTKNAIYGNNNIIKIDKEPNGFNNLLYLFRDTAFVNKYISYLKKYSNNNYVSNILSENKKQISYFKEILKYEFPDYEYNEDFLKSNSKSIREELPKYIKKAEEIAKTKFENPKFVHNKKYNPKYNKEVAPFYVKAWKNNDSIEVISYYPHKINIVGVSINKKIISDPFVNYINLAYFETSKFKTNLEDEIYLFFKVEGQKDLLKISVKNYRRPSNYNPVTELINKVKLKSNEYYKIEDNKVIFKNEKIAINQNIIIPQGYEVIINAGTELDFINNSFFLSYSPVYIEGNGESRVVIKSSDKSARGFTILQANKKSIVEYANFENFNTLTYKKWSLTGAVNFYESDVNISNTSFNNNLCEDALNIVRSNFYVTDCKFNNIFSDAFDSDFCTGKLTKTNFNKIGNDAIDFSGSNVDIADCEINEIGDKGISGGEKSILNVENCYVNNANIGFASKDKSVVTLKKCVTENCKYGLVALQKKPEYDFAEIIATDFEWQNVIELYAIEKKSKLSLNGKAIKGNIKKLAKRFY